MEAPRSYYLPLECEEAEERLRRALARKIDEDAPKPRAVAVTLEDRRETMVYLP